MIAIVETAFGLYEVDVLDESAVLGDSRQFERRDLEISLPLLVAADRVGSRVVAVVARRPPLVVSDDGASTWREIGGGLPPGRAIAIDPDAPDRMLFASASRLFLSEDGGLFWHVLAPELMEIMAVRFVH